MQSFADCLTPEARAGIDAACSSWRDIEAYLGWRPRDQLPFVTTANSLVHHQLRQACALGYFALPAGERWPIADLSTPIDSLLAAAQMRPIPRELESRLDDATLAAYQARMAMQMQAMSDLTADVFDAVNILWLREATNPDAMVTVDADQILEVRGLLKHKSGSGRRGGYPQQWRREIALHIGILSTLMVSVTKVMAAEMVQGKRAPYPRWQPIEYESPALVVSIKAGARLPTGDPNIYVWRVRPGDIFTRFLFGPGRQVALMARQALEYDPYR